MKVKELIGFLSEVEDNEKEVFFYAADDNPFNEGNSVENAFVVLDDMAKTGAFAGVYLTGGN